MVEHQQIDAGAEPLGEHRLLLVAAAEVAAHHVDGGGLDETLLHPVLRVTLLHARTQEAQDTERFEHQQVDILRHGHGNGQSLVTPVDRDMPDAQPHRVARRAARQPFPQQRHAAALGPFLPHNAPADGFLSRPHQSDQADDLTLPHREAEWIEQPLAAEISDLQYHIRARLGLVGLPKTVLRDRVPDHQPFDLRDPRLGGGHLRDVAAVAQDHDPVRVFNDLLQSVGNEHHRRILFQLLQRGKEGLPLAVRQHGSRLVEDQHGIFLPIERREPQQTGDLDHLARGGIHIAHQRVHVDLDVHSGQDGLGRLLHRAPGKEAAPGEDALVAEEQVLHDRQVGHQGAFLEHHAYAVADGSVRVLQHDARAVLPDQPQDLVPKHVEVDRIERDYTREHLGDLLQTEDRVLA